MLEGPHQRLPKCLHCSSKLVRQALFYHFTSHESVLNNDFQRIEWPRFAVLVERSVSLGGGQTPVTVHRGATVAHLKQSIHRQCTIAPSRSHLLLLHNKHLEPLDNDDQLLDTVGITERSSVFATLQGTSN